MTENKRFDCTENGFVVDYNSEQKVLNLYDTVNILNQLNDENEQLKHRLKHYEMWFKQEEIREIEIGDWKMKFTSDETNIGGGLFSNSR